MASSVPVVDLGKKRKPEESSNDEDYPHSDCESDSDSDFACEAPDGGNACSIRSSKRLQSAKRPLTHLKRSSGVCVSSTKKVSSDQAEKNPVATNIPVSPDRLPEASSNELNVEVPDHPMEKDQFIEESVELNVEVPDHPMEKDQFIEESVESKIESDEEEEAAQIEEDDPSNSSASVPLSSETGVQRSGSQSRTREDGGSFVPVGPWSHLKVDSVAKRTRMNPNTWVVGHSYVREAVLLIRYEPSLLAPGGMDFHWIGVQDLSIVHLREVIMYNLKVRKLPPPDYLVIHVGGNDLVTLDHMVLRCRIISELQGVLLIFPEVSLFWSEIIYRRNWESEDTPGSCNAAIRNLNANVRALACALPRLQIIRHSVLYDEYSEEFFHEDGVHLSQAGTRLFISTIVGAVRLASLSSENAD